MSCPLSPSGPITAVALPAVSGSTAPSFLSSTVDRPAARRAWARLRGSSCLPSAAATFTYGLRNSPARNFTRRIRRTASSIRSRETLRSRTSWGMKSR